MGAAGQWSMIVYPTLACFTQMGASDPFLVRTDRQVSGFACFRMSATALKNFVVNKAMVTGVHSSFSDIHLIFSA
jgi:hypothetical protein